MKHIALPGGVLVGLLSLFSPHRKLVPLGKVPLLIVGALCVCVGGEDVVQVVFGLHTCTAVVPVWASPACWLQARLEWPWSNLLCFLTPVKLHSEVYMCTCALPHMQNFLQPSLYQPVASTSHRPPALFHSLQERRKRTEKSLGCGHLRGKGGPTESRMTFFVVFTL
jgi:hypothetical protein